MFSKKIAIILLGIASATTLISCSTSPAATSAKQSAAQNAASADLKSTYAQLEKSGGKVYTLDPKTSSVRIYVFRGGLATKLVTPA